MSQTQVWQDWLETLQCLFRVNCIPVYTGMQSYCYYGFSCLQWDNCLRKAPCPLPLHHFQQLKPFHLPPPSLFKPLWNLPNLSASYPVL